MAEVAVKSTAEGGGTAALTVSVLCLQLRGEFPEPQPFLSVGIIPKVRPHSGNLPHPPHVPQALHVLQGGPRPRKWWYNPYFKTSMASVPSCLVKWSP